MEVRVTQSAKGLSCVKDERELGGSQLGVSQSPPAQWPPRVATAGFSHCAWNPEETALNIAFLLLHGGRSANKIGTRLEGQWERNFHSGACRHLRATQEWMQLSFSHLSLPGSLLAWELEFMGPKSSLTYLH